MQKAIPWANDDPDLCRYGASSGPNELTHRISLNAQWIDVEFIEVYGAY